MSKRILIIDDEPDIVEMVTIMLESGGYETIGTHGGNEAIELLNEMKSYDLPDLILLDIMMEPLDGWDTLKLIKKDLRLKAIPVSMLTAVSLIAETLDNENIELIENYITKPFTTEQLLSKVAEIVGVKKTFKNFYKLIENKFGKEKADTYKSYNDKVLRHSRLLEVLEESTFKEKEVVAKSTLSVLQNEKRMIRMWRAKMDEIEIRVS